MLAVAHDIHHTAAAAVPTVIEFLTNCGVQFVTVTHPGAPYLPPGRFTQLDAG
jgi:hypothetical protein